MKFSLTTTTCLLGVLSSFSATTMVGAVTREECKADYLPAKLACIDSFAGQGTPDCDYLPIPDFAMPQNQANEMGYWIQELRNTDTSHVYAVSDNGYISMIVVDVSPDTLEAEVGKRNLKGSRKLDEEEVGLMEGPDETSDDDVAEPFMIDMGDYSPLPGISVSFIDFPPTFLQYDETGAPAGSILISALEDIMAMLNATTADVANVEMIYTHAHTDHIGLGTHTYDYLTETLGFSPDRVPVIASDGVVHHIEEAIHGGFWQYRAPMPNVTFTGVAGHQVGFSTSFTMTTFDGHSHGDKDVIVFFDAVDEENPAIMMVVDVVFPKWVPFFSFAISTDIVQYVAAHDVLLEYPLGDDGYYVGGHLNQVGDRNDILLNKNLTQAILEGGASALAQVDAWAIVGGTGAFTPDTPNFGNSWLGFGAYFDELVRVCSREVLAEYGCDFGGLDVTLPSSCEVAQSFWRVEV